MSILYTQRSRKDGDNGAWTMGVESFDRNVIVNNIMETVGEDMDENEWNEAEARLIAAGRLHIDVTSYDIFETEA